MPLPLRPEWLRPQSGEDPLVFSESEKEDIRKSWGQWNCVQFLARHGDSGLHIPASRRGKEGHSQV